MLPVNRDVEKALLGCCILGDFTDVVAAGVSADWFNEIEHKAAFHLMERVSEKEPVNETAVLNAARLDETYKENNGSLSDLIEMTNAAPVAGNWQYWMPELQPQLHRVRIGLAEDGQGLREHRRTRRRGRVTADADAYLP